jgi:hypothetical protein
LAIHGQVGEEAYFLKPIDQQIAQAQVSCSELEEDLGEDSGNMLIVHTKDTIDDAPGSAGLIMAKSSEQDTTRVGL